MWLSMKSWITLAYPVSTAGRPYMVLADNNPTIHANKNLFFICDIFLIKCGQALIKKICLSHQAPRPYSRLVPFAYKGHFLHFLSKSAINLKICADNSLIINKP